MSENFILEENRGALRLLRLNRPEKLNALSPQMLEALATALEKADQDKDLRVVIIQGLGRAFAAGADIAVMANASPIDILQGGTRDSWKRIWATDLPIIAAVNGYAYGGGSELALSCDLIVAGENARFAQPEIKLGIIPGAGATQRLAKAIGPNRAMEMILTGEPVASKELHAAGLINRLVPDELVLNEALELAELIAQRPRVAVRLARHAIRYGTEHTMKEGLEMERRNYLMLYDTEDQKEGMAAFLEKRKPKFKGK
jgi:enoyl-CoA hydratase